MVEDGVFAQGEGELDRFNQGVKNFGASGLVVGFSISPIQGEVEEVDQTLEFLGALGVEDGVGGHTGVEPQILGLLVDLVGIGTQQGFSPGEVDVFDPEALEVMQVMHDGFKAGFFFGVECPDVTEMAAGVAAVGQVVVGDEWGHNTSKRNL